VTLTSIRQHFLIAATAAARLLSDPAVAAHWDQESALTDFSIRGLAGHLGLQVFYVTQAIAEPAPSGEAVSIEEHYNNAAWMNAPLDSEANSSIREMGEAEAKDGPAALAGRVTSMVAGLQNSFQLNLAERLVHLPWSNRRLKLDDFLLTRLMEITVHSDDLAVSVGVPTPRLPPEVLEPVIELLTGLALRRHGGLALLRALSRQERAPKSIAAF
jgi:hypothetical protein